MTAIVGVVDREAIWMGGDSAGVDSAFGLQIRADTKVFVNPPYIFGFTSSFRMGQLLRHALAPPEQVPSLSVDKFMSTVFVDAVRNCLKAGGYAKRENEVEHAGSFLVGYRGRLFHIQSDYQVAQASQPYAATGCAVDVALGALHAIFRFAAKMPPAKKVTAALEACERFSAGVR